MPTKISEILGQKRFTTRIGRTINSINYVIRYHTNITTTAHIQFISLEFCFHTHKNEHTHKYAPTHINK